MSSVQTMGALVAPRHTTQGGGLHERSMDGSSCRIVGLRTTPNVPCTLRAGHPNHDGLVGFAVWRR